MLGQYNRVEPPSPADHSVLLGCAATRSLNDREVRSPLPSIASDIARPSEFCLLVVIGRVPYVLLVTYIASPLASATTGAALRVDGGVIKSAF